MNATPPAYVINLDRSVERLRLFREKNGHLSDVTRVSAVDGMTVHRDGLVEAGYMSPDLSYPPGTLGCALSHVKIWMMAVARQQAVTVFEDDVLISHHFEQSSSEILAKLPVNWDIIQWGCTLNPLFAWVDVGVSRVKLEGYAAARYQDDAAAMAFQLTRCPIAVVRLLHSFGMYGYSISSTGARKALQFLLPLRDRMITFPDAGVTTLDVGIDVAMCGFYPSASAFLCLSPLVIHRHDIASDRRDIDRGPSGAHELGSWAAS